MKTQVAIVGAGPGGCACAIYLARQGIQSVLIEREPFPRYHVGESMTGEAGWLLRDLGLEKQMLAARHPVKHGVNVWGTNGKNRWWVPVMARLDDGSLQDQTTWQVRRSEFDKMLLDNALAAGATLIPGRATQPIMDDTGAVCGTHVQMADGGKQTINSELLLDCSGQATWLATRGVTGPKYLGAYDKQIAIFSQVIGLRRDDAPPDGLRQNQAGNTHIFYKDKFHWAWVIPIDDEVTSVGIVAPSQYYLGKHESKQDYLARELKELNPALAERIPEVKFVEDVHVIPNYSLQVKNFAGRGYICIGDAHRFLDPIFSFGLYVTLREASLIGPVVRDYLNGKNRDLPSPFEDHMLRVEHGADMFEDLIDSFWENPLALAVFAHVRHREDLIDMFAGRVFDREPSPGVLACRELLGRTRTYEPGGNYSTPVGSRYQPERAGIWNADLDAVATTEAWMRDG